MQKLYEVALCWVALSLDTLLRASEDLSCHLIQVSRVTNEERSQVGFKDLLVWFTTGRAMAGSSLRLEALFSPLLQGPGRLRGRGDFRMDFSSLPLRAVSVSQASAMIFSLDPSCSSIHSLQIVII